MSPLLVIAPTCFLALIHLSLANSLTFELPYGQRKCFSEDLPPNVSVRGTVHVSSGQGEMSLDLIVLDDSGVVHSHKSDVNSVKFSFRSGNYPHHTRQDYRFCIVTQVKTRGAEPAARHVTRRVTLEVDVAPDDTGGTVGRLAKQEHMDKVYQSFLSVSNEVDELIERMDELRAKEQLLTEANELTTKVILRISLVACAFTIATGILNVLSLQRFFKRKKLA